MKLKKAERGEYYFHTDENGRYQIRIGDNLYYDLSIDESIHLGNLKADLGHSNLMLSRCAQFDLTFNNGIPDWIADQSSFPYGLLEFGEMKSFLEKEGYENIRCLFINQKFKLIMLYQMIFNYSLIVINVNEKDLTRYKTGWDERYDFSTRELAEKGLNDWLKNPTKEPVGWHRHIPSDRRRENGDPTKETIRG